MNALAHYQQLVELAIQEHQIPQTPAHLYDSIRYIMSLGGKRLRPVMVFMACDVMGGELHKATPVALSIEYFHNFSLMHDDIMDRADLRRGKPSVHKKWNTATAILGGDALLVKAYELLVNSHLEKRETILKLFNQTALEVCEGQQLDMNFEEEAVVNVDDYLEMIRLKTAVLMGASFKMGALVAGANEHEAQQLYRFGQDMGIAFQLKDDYLDCFGKEGFGKVVGGDIVENKKTYLHIKAHELGNEDDIAKLVKLQAQTNAKLKVTETKKLYESTGAKQATEQLMERYYQQALSAVDSMQIKTNEKQLLQDFAASIWQRQK